MLLTFRIHFCTRIFWERSILQEPTIQLGSWLVQPYIIDDSTYLLMIHLMKTFFDRGNGNMYKDTFDKAFRRDRFNIEIVFVKLKNG